MSQTVSQICSATSFVVCSSQITRVVSRISSAAFKARVAWVTMLRAVTQMVISRPAATRTTADATSIHSRQAAHKSAPVIAVLTAGALVDVVPAVAGSIDAPEAILLTGRPSRLLGGHVLPLAVEELDRPVRERLRLDVRPSAGDLAGDVPAMLAIGLPVGEPPQSPDDTAHGPGRERRHGGAGWRFVERAELVGEAGHRAADAHAAGLHATTHVVDGPALNDVAVDDGPPAPDLDEALGISVVLGEDALLVEARARATVVHRVAEQPRRAAEFVERRQRPEPLEEQQDGEDGLREVVALGRAARNVDDRQAERAAVVLAEEVHDAHGAGRIAFGRRDSAPRGAGADRDRGGGAGHHAFQ